jgi:uncharacterized membrane protein
MKIVNIMVIILALAMLSGCNLSSRGGSQDKDEGFKISVPAFAQEIKQGEVQSVTVSLQRDEQFKQDVTLEMEAAKEISVDPARVTVKASDIPATQLRVSVPEDAALGEYPVTVKGTPETGEATSVAFTVKVIAP